MLFLMETLIIIPKCFFYGFKYNQRKKTGLTVRTVVWSLGIYENESRVKYLRASRKKKKRRESYILCDFKRFSAT